MVSVAFSAASGRQIIQALASLTTMPESCFSPGSVCREAPSLRLARPKRQVERAPHDTCKSASASPAPVVQEEDARLFATHVVMDRDDVDPAGAERLQDGLEL